MKTKEDIVSEMKNITATHSELLQALNQIEYERKVSKAESLSTLYRNSIGKCFEHPENFESYYKIFAVEELYGIGSICSIILFRKDTITVTDIVPNGDEIEITLEQFNTKLNQSFQNILNK